MKYYKLLFLCLIPLVSCRSTETSTDTSFVDESTYVSATYHHVRFVNYDNTLLEEQDVQHGQPVTYKGILPVKPEDDEFTYEFLTWDKDLSSITSDITAKATYTAKPKENWGSAIWF